MDRDRAAPGRHDGWLTALGAFVVFVLLGRHAWHGIDALALLGQYRLGGLAHPYHVFYLPALKLLDVVIQPFGGDLYRAALGLSALGAAVSVWCTHRAARMLGADRGGALFAALLMASTPAVMYFATIAEVHGLVLAFCGVVLLAMARWATRPSLFAALGVGAALVLAYLAHPTAALLGLGMVPLWLLRRPPTVGLAVGCGVALLVLVAGVLAVPPLLRWLGWNADAGFALDYLSRRSQHEGRLGLAEIAVTEFFVPLLPLAVGMLALLASARTRWVGFLILLANVPFVLTSWLMLLAGEYERGAYSTAAVGVSAVVVALHWRAMWWRVAAIAAGIGVASMLMLGLHAAPRNEATAGAIAAATSGPLFWLVGDEVDFQVQLMYFPGAEHADLASLLSNPADLLAPSLAALDRRIEAAAANGLAAVVSSNALAALERVAPVLPTARTLQTWLLARQGPELGRSGQVAVFAVRVP